MSQKLAISATLSDVQRRFNEFSKVVDEAWTDAVKKIQKAEKEYGISMDKAESTIQSNGAPKKRGRPAKAKPETATPSTPKKRGRPAKTAPASTEGHGAKSEAIRKYFTDHGLDTSNKVVAEALGVKYGLVAVVKMKMQKNDSAPSKRGRPRKEVVAADAVPAVAPKKRGRPRKEKTEGDTPPATPKKRGRPRKEKTEEVVVGNVSDAEPEPPVQQNSMPLAELIQKILSYKKHREGLKLDALALELVKAGHVSKSKKGRQGFSQIVWQTLHKLMAAEEGSQPIIVKDEAGKRYKMNPARDAA